MASSKVDPKQKKNHGLTPMMRQYKEHKERHPHSILLFRMGDFYEMFYDDAEKASKILDIALTTRDKNREESVPMCGFPHHSASAYITRLLASGERVAVCDQMEDPRQAKGLVRREVTRVLTPGLTEEPETLKSPLPATPAAAIWPPEGQLSANEDHVTFLVPPALSLATVPPIVPLTSERRTQPPRRSKLS